jgi:hypothetical protein
LVESVELWSGWVWQEPTPEEANQVLFVFSHGGYRPGGFTAALLEAMIRADPRNLTRLASGFPGLASSVHAAKHVDDGLDRLRVVAENVTKASRSVPKVRNERFPSGDR